MSGRKILIGAFLSLNLWLACGCSGQPGGTELRPAVLAPTGTTPTATPETTSANRPVPIGSSAPLELSELPPEARETLAEIRKGPPYRFEKDGTIFQNRERCLPVKPRGYYREFTVVTHGLRSRGARRIIVGRDGDKYYTDDHYRSFREIRE